MRQLCGFILMRTFPAAIVHTIKQLKLDFFVATVARQ
jgi:hypothetical protein